MTSSNTRKLAVLLTSGALMLGLAGFAQAQASDSAATDSTSASAPATKAQQKAQKN